jgi:hypothetical protein
MLSADPPIWVGMRQTSSTSTKSRQSARPDALTALVRLLARQAAQEFVLDTPAQPDGNAHPQDRK